jgi:hypothetical protein
MFLSNDPQCCQARKTGIHRLFGFEGSSRGSESVQTEPLTIKQTPTGYWVVQRGSVHLAGAPTLRAAEAERDLLDRLRSRSLRRPTRARSSVAKRPSNSPS